MNDLQKDMLAQVDQHLPKMVAAQLKARIELVDSLEAENKALKLQNDDLKKQKEAFEKLTLQKSELDLRQTLLDKREKEVLDKEIKAELERAKHALSCSEVSRNSLFDFMRNLTTSPVVRKTFMRQVAQPNGCYQNFQGVTEEEETKEV